MSYSVEYSCAACHQPYKMHVPAGLKVNRPPGEFLCHACGMHALTFGNNSCSHSFWGFSADANGDVDMVSCHSCGHVYFGVLASGTVISTAAPMPAKVAPPVLYVQGKFGNCTSCGRELSPTLDAVYNEPMTRCSTCRSRNRS
jgi:hypothetical protein